jgi:precorrin-6A/cobalt-precorrin-6A reductase
LRVRSDPTTRILILGGTTEARLIANALVVKSLDVTTSLAGVTSKPVLPDGKIRTGGFGGTEGLRAYLIQNEITHLVDATHPYAAIISRNAFEAVQGSATTLVRFERPAWTPQAGDKWNSVASLSEAAATLPAQARVFISTGRKELQPFLARDDLSGMIRTVEPPAEQLPPNWHLLLDRPPHDITSETRLIQQHKITHLLTKNAGSDSTRAKLDAARALRLAVVMVERPQKPATETFHSVETMLAQF